MIDLARLSDEELIDLNRRVVERLRLIRSARQLVDLARFSVGMRVEFPTDDGRTLQGDIARLNRKTATVCGNPSGHWRVSPALLRPIADQQTTVALGARPVRGIAPESVDTSSLVTVVPASSR